MVKKIKINEGTFNRLFIPHSMNEIDRYYYMQQEGLIAEGYYKTYPTDVVIKQINRVFGNHIHSIHKSGDGNIPNINIIVSNDIDYTPLEQVMGLCGYTLDGAYEYGFDEWNLQYSPRYSDDVNDIVKEQKFLYHVAPSYKQTNILKYGLSPRSNNKKYKYPSRVYLFLSHYDDGQYGDYYMDVNALLDRANSLYSVLPSITNEKDKRYKDNFQTWTIYKIDPTKLDGVKFYKDTNWDNSSIFTYDNISPKAIIDFMDYDLDNERPEYDITSNN